MRALRTAIWRPAITGPWTERGTVGVILRLEEGTMRVPLILVLALGLAGCVPDPKITGNELTTHYADAHIDDFVTVYGPPSATWAKSNGHTVYRFERGHDQMAIPLYGTYGTTWYPYAIGCTLLVETDRKDRIVDVGVEKDSEGIWQLSRCQEVFGPPPPAPSTPAKRTAS